MLKLYLQTMKNLEQSVINGGFMRYLTLVPMAFLFIGCATGNSFDHMRQDGSILRVERAGATGIMTTGTTRTEFHDCDSAGQNCQLVDTNKTANQSIMGQMATPAAIAYGSKEIGDGLGDSGDVINNSAGARAGARARVSGGCRGNCN